MLLVPLLCPLDNGILCGTINYKLCGTGNLFDI